MSTLSENYSQLKNANNSITTTQMDIIRKHKDELRLIKSQTDDISRKMESRTKQREDIDTQQSANKQMSISNEIIGLQKDLDELTAKDREEEASVRKRKAKIENEVEAWIFKYDQEMGEKQNEIEELEVGCKNNCWFNIYGSWFTGMKSCSWTTWQSDI